jgi:hypothetical protein
MKVWLTVILVVFAGFASRCPADDVLRLPDGVWIGAPVPVETRPRPKTNEWEDRSREAVLAMPRSPASMTVSTSAAYVMLFPARPGITKETLKRYRFAIADEQGVAADLDDDSPEFRVFADRWVYVDAHVPHHSKTITLQAWRVPEGESQADRSRPPVATATFRNRFADLAVKPSWPAGQKQTSLAWNGVSLELTKSSRKSAPPESGTGVQLEFKSLGQWTGDDFEWVAAVVEDGFGNLHRFSGWGRSSHSEGWQTWRWTSPRRLLWSYPSGLKFTLWLRPTHRFGLPPSAFRRIRLPLPPSWTEATASEVPFEFNGQSIAQIRLRKAPPPSYYKLADWILARYESAVLELRPDGAKGTLDLSQLSIIEVSDGYVPFEDRVTPDLKARGSFQDGELPLWIDKRAEFLEFTIISAVPDKLEFYFQPEWEP